MKNITVFNQFVSQIGKDAVPGLKVSENKGLPMRVSLQGGSYSRRYSENGSKNITSVTVDYFLVRH